MYRLTVLMLPFWVLTCWVGMAAGAEKPDFPVIQDKTLVVWVYVGDLDQHGGSALTIEDGGDLFDGIVFGERTPRRWMAGSSHFARSQSPEDQASNPAETADAKTMVEMAIVYRGKEVTVYRNAERYAQYTINEPLVFRGGSFAVIGLRHVAAGGGACFKGQVEDARIYNVALSAEQIAALEPNRPSEPSPVAWWNFEDDEAADVVKTFPNTKLFGKAKVAGGKLVLDGRGSYLVSARGNVPRWRGSSFGAQPGDARALRARLLADPQRPRYHFVSPEGICHPFDPNGAIFWQGRYHLMYIFQNEKGHCWGHVSSTDLVHWRQHRPALQPGEGDQGIFSGGASLDKDGRPTITYWGLGNPRGICIATSTDDLLETWTKSPHNPVIRETAPGLAAIETDEGEVVYGAADPTAVWVHNGRHYMLTGNLLVLREYGLKRNMPEHQGDTADLFVSDDLAHWRHLHPFYKSDRKWTRHDEDNMCPDFFPLPAAAEGGPASDRHMMLFISHNLGCQYYLGRYAADRFHPEVHGRMTWVDNAFFAPESLVDARGRRIMWAWIFDGRGGETRRQSGWSGTMSLPRVLWLGGDQTLRMRPAEELSLLRYNPRTIEDLTVPADGELPVEGVGGTSIELAVEMLPEGAEQFGLKICTSPGGEEETLVYCDAVDGKLKVDTTRSSLGEGPKSVEAGPLELAPGEPLKLRVFVDKSVVEVFANDRQAVMRRIYPTREDSVGVVLFSRGGATAVKRLEAWDMAAASAW